MQESTNQSFAHNAFPAFSLGGARICETSWNCCASAGRGLRLSTVWPQDTSNCDWEVRMQTAPLSLECFHTRIKLDTLAFHPFLLRLSMDFASPYVAHRGVYSCTFEYITVSPFLGEEVAYDHSTRAIRKGCDLEGAKGHWLVQLVQTMGNFPSLQMLSFPYPPL